MEKLQRVYAQRYKTVDGDKLMGTINKKLYKLNKVTSLMERRTMNITSVLYFVNQF